jgi:hypothetical protein
LFEGKVLLPATVLDVVDVIVTFVELEELLDKPTDVDETVLVIVLVVEGEVHSLRVWLQPRRLSIPISNEEFVFKELNPHVAVFSAQKKHPSSYDIVEITPFSNVIITV